MGASELDAWGGDQSSSVGAYTWSSLRWFQSTEVWMQKEFFCCFVSEWGTRSGLDFRAACQCTIFFTAKS